jgi:hypothetical protein
VNLPMLRTMLLALLAALLVAPAAHADGTRVKILRDCQDDGVLQGDYSASQMRDARSNIPAELDEYSDCRDVLTRAISDKTAPTADSSSTNNGGGSGAGGTGGGGSDDSGSGGDSSGSTTSQPSATSTPAATADSGREFPASAQEWTAINQAQKEGTHLVDDLKQVSPGQSRLTASVGRNGIPGMLVGVLALIVAAALALFAAPLIRRRGLGPRT